MMIGRRGVLTAIFVPFQVLPLLLACAAFTLFGAPFGYSSFNWNYFACAYQNGWSPIYRSDYSLAQVRTYIPAYGSGLVLYPLWAAPAVCRRDRGGDLRHRGGLVYGGIVALGV